MEAMWVNVKDVQIGDVVVNYRFNERSYPLLNHDMSIIDHFRVKFIAPRGGGYWLGSREIGDILSNNEFTQVKVLREVAHQPANERMAKRFEDLVKSLTSSPVLDQRHGREDR